MDLDELQSVQSRERQTDSLQQLRATFYKDAAEYIGRLEEERDRAAERADDPWNSPEVGRLNDDIDTATQTVEAIYERRVGKIVKMASLAAADMPTDDGGLTDEEGALFETLVTAIEDNREAVFSILDGESPVQTPATESGSSVPVDASPLETGPDTGDDRGVHPDPADLSEGDPGGPPERDSRIDAADAMGGSPDRDDTGSDTDGDDSRGDVTPRDERSAPDGGTRSVADARTADRTAGVSTDASESVDRATVRITDDVGEIFGVDDRAYDLTADDVVVLPEANANPLVDRNVAERLD
jgi:DNA replication factor GINS